MTTSRLSEDELRAVFDVFDGDRSNLLSSVELAAALRSMGWTNVTVEHCRNLMLDFFQRIDSGYGEEKQGLTFDEFRALVAQVQLPANSPVECYHAFKLFDRSRLGKISIGDLKTAGERATGRPVTDPFVRELMRSIDVLDKDGYISWDEFRKACAKGGEGTEAGKDGEEVEMPPATIIREEEEDTTADVARREHDAAQAAIVAKATKEERRVQQMGEYYSATIGNVPINIHTRSNTIAMEDVREALRTGFGYEDLADEDQWAGMWDDFVENNKKYGPKYMTTDGLGLTVEGYKRMLQGLGELQ